MSPDTTTEPTTETEPAILLTVDEAIVTRELLETFNEQLFDDLMIPVYTAAPVALGLQMVRSKIDTVLESLEHQLEAAEAL